MSRESNFFEEAYELCHDPNSVVRRTAKGLLEVMQRRNTADGDAPTGSFNIQYFCLNAARTILRAQGLAADATDLKHQCELIREANFPSEKDINVSCGGDLEMRRFVDSFLSQVKSDSQLDGDEFDASYAMRVLCDAITSGDLTVYDGSLDKHPDSGIGVDEADFDYWLSGFNNPDS